VGLGKDGGGEVVFCLQPFAEIESSQLEVFAGGLCEVDMSGIKIAVQDIVIVDVFEGLSQLVEDAPHFLLRQSLAFGFGLSDEFLECASAAVLHDDIDSDVFFVDGVVEVPEDVHVVQPDQRIDLVYDVLLALRGKRPERYLLQHHLTLR